MKKKARLVVDRLSSIGIGYALFQLRDKNDECFEQDVNIVSANSSLLKQGAGISPIAGVLQSLVFASQTCEDWLAHCSEILLYSDCSGMLDMLGKNIADISNPGHQKQVEKIQRFSLKTQRIMGELGVHIVNSLAFHPASNECAK